MDTSKSVVGQKVWMQSGDQFKEATVKEIGKCYMNVELVGEEGRRYLQFRINGKPGTIFDNNKQWGAFRYLVDLDCWWQEESGPVGTEFGPWELEEREWKDMSTNEYLYFSTDDGKTWRRMEDDVSSRESMCRISFAHIVQVKLDNGERCEVEFGKVTQLRSPQ